MKAIDFEKYVPKRRHYLLGKQRTGINTIGRRWLLRNLKKTIVNDVVIDIILIWNFQCYNFLSLLVKEKRRSKYIEKERIIYDNKWWRDKD